MKYLNISFLVMVLIVSSNAWAADERKEEGVKHNGVVFNIAKDRKVEKIGGIYEPEGLDKYVERRMNEVTEHMNRIEAQVEKISQKLEAMSASTSIASIEEKASL